ncbi:hypothetical protein [Paenarthrobacter sp. 22069]|jgi:hypothetical protein|uniref:hypothetical protein n=1 Tax=Paenarthrobacter sp. 22069 TaxID=3453864 RepID=UPI003F8311AC
MTGNPKSTLYRRTLWAGVVLGAIGLLILLFANTFMQTLGTQTFNGSNGFFFALTQVYVLAAQGCLPFSAALISAALVMRYLALASLPTKQQATKQTM